MFPLILAVLGIVASVLLFYCLDPIHYVIALVCLFFHPIPSFSSIGNNKRGFRGWWTNAVNKTCNDLLQFTVLGVGSMIQLNECSTNSDDMDTKYMWCVYNPSSPFGMLEMFMSSKLFTLFSNILLTDNNKQVIVLHEYKWLSLPLVRIWARALNMHLYTDEKFMQAAKTNCHIILIQTQQKKTDHVVLEISQSNNIMIIPVYMTGATYRYIYLPFVDLTNPINMACGATVRSKGFIKSYINEYNQELQNTKTIATAWRRSS